MVDGPVFKVHFKGNIVLLKKVGSSAERTHNGVHCRSSDLHPDEPALALANEEYTIFTRPYAWRPRTGEAVRRLRVKALLPFYSINLRVFKYFKAYFITEMLFLQKNFWQVLTRQDSLSLSAHAMLPSRIFLSHFAPFLL
jgi:hypothetical protein